MRVLLVLLILVFEGLCGDVALCMVGQLRTGSHERVQANIVKNAIEPLNAEVFIVVSRRHEIAHASGAAGCIEDTCVNGNQSRVQRERVGRWGSRRADTTDTELSTLLEEGPVSKYIVSIRIVEDAQAIAQASRLHPSQTNIFQRALRARCKLCYADIVQKEKENARRYHFVLRMRPDYAFYCRLPPIGDIFWQDKKSLWASTHRDYWEIVSRDIAPVLLNDIWDTGANFIDACRPKAKTTEQQSRVESCAYFAMCAFGTRVRAADRFYESSRARKSAALAKQKNRTPPDMPGVIVRPCCDMTATHKVLYRKVHTECDLDRTSVLGNWFLGSASRQGQQAWTTLRTKLYDLMFPHCNESLPLLIPPPPGDDDDDDNDDRFGADDDYFIHRSDTPPNDFPSSRAASPSVSYKVELRR